MKISIITPTNNSGKFIARNINSVINQTYENFEQIVIDKVSTDNTIEVATELYSKAGKNERLKVICAEDSGISDAFNRGLEIANGQIITFLNSDDEYVDENIFSKIVQVFKDEKILFSHGNIYFFDPIRGSVLKTPGGKSLEDGMIFFHPSMFFRKYIFDEYGYFDLKYKYAMDFDLLCRALFKDHDFLNKGIYINKTITRVNFGGVSWENPIEGLNETRVILKSYGMWSGRAKKMFRLNKMKTFFIFGMLKIKLDFILIIFRKIKWKYLRKNYLIN